MSNDEARALVRSLEVLAWEERRDQADDHPTPERLAAYHSGELSAAEDLKVQQHLVLCTDCPALLLDLEDLFDPRHRDLGLSENGVTSAWRDLRSRLGGRGGGKGGLPPAAPAKAWWSWLTAIPSPVYAAATSLLLVLTVGLAVRTASLENRLEDRAAPVLVSPPIILELSIPGNSTRGSSDFAQLTLAPEYRKGNLHIERGDVQNPPFRIRLLRVDKSEVWSSAIPSIVPDDTYLYVEIPLEGLIPGTYQVILEGLDNVGHPIQNEYTLKLVSP